MRKGKTVKLTKIMAEKELTRAGGQPSSEHLDALAFDANAIKRNVSAEPEIKGLLN
jgi:hypothetical protein